MPSVARIGGVKPIPPEKFAYYESEARHARSPEDPAHLNPDIPDDARVICVGCGGGWEGEAQGARRFVGVDIDEDAGTYRRLRGSTVEFRLARAEQLPYGAAEFDYYVARVSLMYTNIPKALSEARRVLVQGGGLWITCHGFVHEWRHLVGNIRARALAAAVYRVYVILNGVLFHVTGRTVAFPLNRARTESFQTRGALRRGLERAGFTDVAFPDTGRGHLLVTARAAPMPARAPAPRSWRSAFRRFRVPVLFTALVSIGEELSAREAEWGPAARLVPIVETRR